MLVVLLALGSPTHPVGAERLERLDEQLQGRLGPLHGLRAPELRPAVRPPVLAPVDRLPRHPGRDACASAASTTSRTRAAPPTRSGPTRSPIRRAGSSTGPNVWGFTACDGPGKMHLTDRTGRSRYFLDYSARGAGRWSHHRRRHDRADRRHFVACRSRPRSPSRPTEEMHSRYGKYIYSKYGFFDSFNRSFTATDVKLSRRPRRSGVRLDREGLPRHRPRPHPRDDLQLPQRARLGRHAQVRAPAARPRSAPGSLAAGSTGRPDARGRRPGRRPRAPPGDPRIGWGSVALAGSLAGCGRSRPTREGPLDFWAMGREAEVVVELLAGLSRAPSRPCRFACSSCRGRRRTRSC